MYETDDGITFEGPKKAIQIKRGKYIALQICDDEDVETMIQSFEQQQEMSVIELCVEVDVAGASAINLTNSLLSCGNNMSHNESGSATVGTNSEEDFDDDDYLISNSYAEDSLDEDEDINEMSDTDDEAARLIEPLTVVQSGEGGSQTPFWDSASHYSNINWSYPDQEEICGYTPCKHIFDRNFDKFCELSPPVKAWIGKISKEKWTMAYDKEGRRYGHMTTNLSECVNKVFKGCRNVPITALVKSTYSRCRKYFVDRGRQAQREIRDGTFHGPPSGAFGVGSSLFWVNEGVPPEGGEDPNMPVILYPGWKSCGYEYIGAICDGSWVNTGGV
ncbi:hypothetical protein GmHk_11G032220 [Glycine max]|nr:hypothetical protein GmHk_11G032220 [Glycine max]